MLNVNKSSYEPMRDNPTAYDEHAFAAGVAAAKFCSMGVVSSQKWFSSFVIVSDGLLKLYDDEKSYQNNPSGYILQISLSNYHRASDIRRKAYAQDPSKSADLYCFYVEIDNGVFFPTKLLKLGFLDRSTAVRFSRAVNANCAAF